MRRTNTSVRRRATPKPPVKPQNKIVCGYLRLSVDRDGNKIGYEIQKKDIQAWAEKNGFTIGRWYYDKDVTAADLEVERKGYKQMLADLAAGMWGGIVVWRLDRLVRLTREFEECWGIVEDSKGFIAAIGGPQPVVTFDPMGLFIMRLLVMLADMEIQGMKVRNAAHQRAKAEAGKWKGGGPRSFGFEGPKRDKDERITNSGRIGVAHVPHEVALLREAGRRIAKENWNWADVIADWHSRTPPVYGGTGKPWSVQALQRVLTGARIVGLREFEIEDPDTGEREVRSVKAEWDPILDMETWEQLCALVTVKGPNGPKYRYPLSGIVSCGICQQPLTGTKRKYPVGGIATTTRTYRCRAGVEAHARGSCGKLSVLAEPVENLVVTRVLRHIEAAPQTAEIFSTADSGLDDELSAALAIIAACDTREEAVSRRFGSGGCSETAWFAALDEISLERTIAQREVDRISRALDVPVPTSNGFEQLVQWFEALTVGQQRKVLSTFVEQASVDAPGRSGRYFKPERVKVRLRRPH